jgi:predicted ATPase
VKDSEIGDHWRDVYEKTYPWRVDKLVYRNIRSLGTGELQFRAGVTAICGTNGAGKTTLLSCLLAALDSRPLSTRRDLADRLVGGEVEVDGHLPTSTFNRLYRTESGEANPSELDVNTVWIDPSHDAPRILSLYRKQGSIDEVLEGYEARQLTSEEVDNLSYVVGRAYSKIAFYEPEFVTFGDEEDDPKTAEEVPYFAVEADGTSYAGGDLGLGEFCAHYIWWHAQRSPRGTLLLIEEPETYLSQLAQERLINVLAKMSAKNKLWIAFTTHSGAMLGHIPPEHVRYISRYAGKAQVMVPHAEAQYLPALGVRVQKRLIVLTEDKAAREFTHVWLAFHAPQSVQQK